MLQLTIQGGEYFDDSKQEFVYPKAEVLQLEHSLISISKWESKWKKPFLSEEPRSIEESQDYVRCMTLNKVPDEVYYTLTQEHYNQILSYIDDKMSATWFNDRNQRRGGGRGQKVTSELIYYWMIAFGIPFECQKWHLNRLLTLIHICEIKEGPTKKMSRKDTYAQYAALNAARRKKMGTRG